MVFNYRSMMVDSSRSICQPVQISQSRVVQLPPEPSYSLHRFRGYKIVFVNLTCFGMKIHIHMQIGNFNQLEKYIFLLQFNEEMQKNFKMFHMLWKKCVADAELRTYAELHHQELAIVLKVRLGQVSFLDRKCSAASTLQKLTHKMRQQRRRYDDDSKLAFKKRRCQMTNA